MFDHILNIWRKELMDSVRDKRALRQALLVPMILGAFYAVFNPLLGSLFESRAEEAITIPVQGLVYADDTLIDVFTQFGITLEPFDGDMAATIEAGDENAGLVIPPGFAANVAAETPAIILVRTNEAAGGMFGGSLSIGRLNLALNTYNQIVTAQRLQMRDLDPGLIRPVTLDVADLATPAQRAGVTAAFFLPLLIAITAVQGGMFVAIDVTAGEKERGTLEALLVTPANDLAIFIGKLLAVFTITIVPVALTLLSFWGASNLLPDSLSEGAFLPFQVVVMAVLATLPLALFADVVLMIVSIRTKAFRDAQSALTPIVFATMFISMAAAFVPPAEPLLHLIPVYGTAALVGSLAGGQSAVALTFAYTLIGSLAATAVLVGVAMRLFNRERLLYSA